MKKTLLLCGALIAISATTAFAAGINLSYNDCGTFGTENKTFACNTNSGNSIMVASFVAPAGIGQYLSCESNLEIQTDSATLPDWWQFKNAGTCRSASLSLSGDFTSGPFNCTDFFAGAAAGGIGAYNPGYTLPNRARIVLVLAVPSANAGPLNEGEQYYAYKLTFNNAKSIGTGSCAGCLTPACINTRFIKLVQPLGAPGGDVTVSNPADRAYVRWQSASAATCVGATPTRNSTWGSVKALYR